MEILEHRSDKKELSIFMLGDIHEGNANHNEKKIKEAVDFIAKEKKHAGKDKEVFVITGGDICDCIKHDDPRFSPTEISEKYKLRDLKDLPRKQFQYAVNNMEPIKDLIKYSIIGNHEEKFIKYNGFDVYDYFCKDLLNSKKLGFASILNLNMNKGGHGQIIRIGLTHGTSGGGYREGYHRNHITDVFKYWDVNVCVHFHIHKLDAWSIPKLTSSQTAKLKKTKKWFAAGGCFLETYCEGNSGYFEGRKGTLSDIGFLELKVWKVGSNWEYKLIPHLL